MLKKLELTAGDLLRQKAVRDRLKRSDRKQHAAAARLQSRYKYYEKKGDKSDREDGTRSSGSSGRESSPPEPERK